MRTSMTKWIPLTLAVTALLALTSLTNAQETSPNAKEKSAAAKLAKQEQKEKRAEKVRTSRIWKTAAPVAGFESAEMFAAMEEGSIEVVIKTVDEKKSNLMVKNTSDKPLAIVMPETFSAVPVMRQGGFGGGGLGGGGLGGGGLGGGGLGGGGGGLGGGGGRGVGGGIGGGGRGGGLGAGGGLGGGRGGGGVFNIPPGKVGKLSLTTVCLEHGKPNPRAAMDYEIKPLSAVTTDPKVAEICRMIANDEITQPVAQAASWSITDGLSWQEMLVKNRIERMDGYFERFFSPNQVAFAQQVVAVAAQRAEERREAMKDDDVVVSPPQSTYKN